MDQSLRDRVSSWIDGDPDAEDRAELRAALDAGNEALLRARFAGRLSFGTAGLRGPIGAGPCAMNRAVIRQTCHGLADVLDQERGDPARGVVIGFDARQRSQCFADDAAAVLRGRGYTVYLWDRPGPTPATSYWLMRLGALAGIQVTASHNPPQDNGFKVYWHHGAQIIEPVDAQIAAAIERHAQGPACDLALLKADEPGPELHRLEETHLEHYWRAVASDTPAASDPKTPIKIVYSAMHGVGGESVVALLEEAGFDVHVVAEQHEPDGLFPTLAFPNPEEDGAMDLALALAQRVDADLVLANDPDADRLAVALEGEQGFALLNGNEIGLLLGDHCLQQFDGEGALVCASIVSSQALSALARVHNQQFSTALTGFKWIMAERRRQSERPFLFGYEEALGYCVGETVADKDGVSAALAFAHYTRNLRAQGSDLATRLGEIYDQIGAFVSEQWVQRFEGLDAASDMAAAVQKVRANAPQSLAGLNLTERLDFLDGAPWDKTLRANLLALSYGNQAQGLRVLVRPSGTEPKVKTYFEYHSAAGVEVARRGLKAALKTWPEEVNP